MNRNQASLRAPLDMDTPQVGNPPSDMSTLPVLVTAIFGGFYLELTMDDKDEWGDDEQ